MDNVGLYQDIAKRTDGDIYIGVVGPVRTGKSTFIKKFMDLLVIPNIDNEYKKEAEKLGAKGFINKDIEPEELLHILEAINNGSTYFEKDGVYVEELTETEKQVLRMLANGIKRKEIAEQLFMSERTVSNHLQHIFEKLGVSSAVEAVTKAIQLGYIPPI